MDIAGLSGRVGLRFNFLNLGAFPMEHGALGCHAGWQKCGMAWAAAGLFQGRPATAVAYCGCCAASSVGLCCLLCWAPLRCWGKRLVLAGGCQEIAG